MALATTHLDETSPGSLSLPTDGRRLVVVTPTFAPEPLGTPLYATDTVRWLAAAGWDVEVVTSQPFYPHFERYPGFGRGTRRDTVDGVPVRRLPTVVPRGGRTRWRLASDANFLAQGASRAVSGAVTRAHTVLSISPGSPVAPMVGAMATRRGGRHVCLVHDVQSGLASGLGMIHDARLVAAVRAVERRALGLADEVLVLSDQMAGVLGELGVRAPISVLPLWSTVTPPTTLPLTVTDLQFSGNFGRKQGLDQLVPLLQALRARRPSTTVTLRGAGPLRSALQAELDAAGLDIRIEDPVDDVDLPAALRASRVHLVPQLASTGAHVVPSKIVNALAVGGAVLAMSAPGSPVARMSESCDAIRVVAPGDIEGAAAAACALLDGHDDAALRRSATAYAAAHHDRDRLLRRLHDILIGDRATTA